MTLAQNLPKTATSSWHSPFKLEHQKTRNIRKWNPIQILDLYWIRKEKNAYMYIPPFQSTEPLPLPCPNKNL